MHEVGLALPTGRTDVDPHMKTCMNACTAKGGRTMTTASTTHQRTWTVPQPVPALATPTYLVDGDCGFCVHSMARVLRRFPDTFEAVPYRDADLARFGLTEEQCSTLGHFLRPMGSLVVISSGSGSWAGILAEQGRVFRSIAAVMRHRPGKWVADRVYAWVARHRGQLGRFVP